MTELSQSLLTEKQAKNIPWSFRGGWPILLGQIDPTMLKNSHTAPKKPNHDRVHGTLLREQALHGKLRYILITSITDDIRRSTLQQPESKALDQYPLDIIMTRQQKQVGQWFSDSWHCEALPSGQETNNQNDQQTALTLQLHRDERAAYRMNLSSHNPRIFVICEMDEDEACETTMLPTLVTASQDLASSYMDGGEEDVFSVPMPYALQCWIEAFMGRHGEDTSNSGKRRFRDKSASGEKKQGKKA